MKYWKTIQFLIITVCVGLTAVFFILFKMVFQGEQKEEVFVCGTSHLEREKEMKLVNYDTAFYEIREESKAIFKSQCKMCHSMDKYLVGPPLGDVIEKRDTSWIYKYITNSDSLFESGDSITILLREEEGHFYNHEFELSREEVIKLMEFCNYPLVRY